MLSEKSQKRPHLHDMFRRGQCIEIERFVASWEWGFIINGHEGSSWGRGEIFLKLVDGGSCMTR